MNMQQTVERVLAGGETPAEWVYTRAHAVAQYNDLVRADVKRIIINLDGVPDPYRAYQKNGGMLTYKNWMIMSLYILKTKQGAER